MNASSEFDVLILGGGINGAGVARDLALRSARAGAGLRIALVERDHFASAASSKNSHLIHGGLRYLKQLQVGLVREALRERATLLAIAPHLVRPQPFLMPMYGRFASLYYGAGLWAYDLLAGSRRIGWHHRLSRAEVRRLEPDLASEGLTSAAVFFDARVEAARLVLENIFDAARLGAVVRNYTCAESWTREGSLWRVAARDTLTGERFEIRARKLVDATGPWQPGLRRVRGSHLVFPRLTASGHAIACFEESGRIVFVIPFGENHSLVGTTDCDHEGGPGEVRITAGEVEYLMRQVKRLFQSRNARPVSAFSALRPLAAPASGPAAAATREHRIWNDSQGVLHIAGGKFTTYRRMSEEAADLVAAGIAPPLRGLHLTAATPIPEAPRESYARFERRLTDFLFISTRIGYERRWTRDALLPYADEMGARLGWNAETRQREIERALAFAALPE
jgi:glycerol-3-phosphate dehydrogenase